jgi:hypothetical protein
MLALVPLDGSTVSHHAIITLAIRLSRSAVASRSHCQASLGGCSKLRRSVASSLGHDRPSNARHLVGNGNGDELGRLLGQQPDDPGMLLRMLPGVSNNRCCTDDEQPSKIAISLLGDAAEPLLAPRRVLPRHKSDPCCKIPTGFEVTRVCDRGSDGRGPDYNGAAPVRATVNELLTIWVRDWQRERPAPREELMDIPTSAAPDEKTPPPEAALATQIRKEKSNPSGPLEISAERFNSSVARLTSNSIDELHQLVSELQKMQEFLKSEVVSVQRQIDNAVAGINIIVETIGPWKNIAGPQTLPPGTRNVRAGGLAAHIEQRIRVG